MRVARRGVLIASPTGYFPARPRKANLRVPDQEIRLHGFTISDSRWPPSGIHHNVTRLHPRPNRRNHGVSLVLVRADMISFRDIVVGVLIGAASQTWVAVPVSSVAWGFAAWLYVVFLARDADYKPGTSLLFGSPALTRSIVWWTTAAGTSFVVGSIVFILRHLW
jgi:hypothetical protein